MFTTGRHQTIARYELPVICLVGAGLAGDDNMLAMVFDSFATEAVRRISTVRVVGILSIQSSASICRVVSEGEDD